MTVTELKHCRICDGTELVEVLDLGVQKLCGIFPKSVAEDEALLSGPLKLVRCSVCGLVQLSHSYPLDVQYGQNYGYRSGLNQLMVKHLDSIAKGLAARFGGSTGPEVVVDIGSNDGTFLKCIRERLAPFHRFRTQIGFDPTIDKFGGYYDPRDLKVPKFFSAAEYRRQRGTQQADLVTSIACFYDLPDPVQFAADVAGILSEKGVWFLEQSYLGAMLQRNAFDTVCHEHLEYYGLRQIEEILSLVGLVILDFGFNDTNGGSFWVLAGRGERASNLDAVLSMEDQYLDERAWKQFRGRVKQIRNTLRADLTAKRVQGKSVVGLGASTKGNTLLQYCGIGPDLVKSIVEVNPDKYGCITPGTRIPIVEKAEGDYALVLPWHFRDRFIQRRVEQKLIFPLPELEVVG